MPSTENNKLKFKNIKNQLEVPFLIYADIETLLQQPKDSFCRSESTVAYHQHQVYSIGFYFKCMYDDKKSFYKSRRDPECIDWFIKELKKIGDDVSSILNNIIPIKISEEQEEEFRVADKCHICKQEYDFDDIRVRDHSHLTGEYRGSAHQQCNIEFQESRTIPIVFHNLSHYEIHKSQYRTIDRHRSTSFR